MANPDAWHYPRPDLAKAYLKVFDIGLTSAKGVFARRRMGKSEFLEQDLIPAAHKAGYLTAYVNFWDNPDHPSAALLDALGRAVAPKGVAKLLAGLRTPVKAVKASGKVPGLAEGSLEAQLANDKKPAPGLPLPELLRNFDKSGKKLLLVLDEAQVLAATGHANLAHSLRAALDTRKQSIKVIFAGSSETTLRRMFARSSEPFYNWAALEPFELLDEDFVRAMVAKVNFLTRYPLSDKAALSAFKELHNTPEFLRRYLNRYLTHAQQGSAAALEDTKEHVFNDANFTNNWNALLPADREILEMMAHGVSDLHGVAARERLGKALGLATAVAMNTPQQSLRRLQNDGVVTRIDRGAYRFEDDAFAHWVRQHGLDAS